MAFISPVWPNWLAIVEDRRNENIRQQSLIQPLIPEIGNLTLSMHGSEVYCLK